MLRAALALSVIVGLGGTGEFAQTRPDFSGHWRRVPERSVVQGPEGPIDLSVFGEEFTITQDAKALTIAIANESPFVWLHQLDGTESHNTQPGPDGPMSVVSTTSWRGETLVIVIRILEPTEGRSGVRATHRELWLEADGTLAVTAPWGADGAPVASFYRRTGPH